jgi:WD40 repeat protein
MRTYLCQAMKMSITGRKGARLSQAPRAQVWFWMFILASAISLLLTPGVVSQESPALAQHARAASQKNGTPNKAPNGADGGPSLKPDAPQRAQMQLYVSQIKLARQEWEHGSFGEVNEALDDTRVSFRGWEYRYLRRLAQDRMRVIASPDKGEQAAVIAPGGQWVASFGVKDTVRVWDAGSERQVCCLAGHYGTIWAVAFSADKKHLACLSGIAGKSDRPTEIKVWDLKTLKEVVTLHAPAGWMGPLAFSPDGKYVASGGTSQNGNAGSIKVWNLASREDFELEGHSQRVIDVAFSPDGRRLASGSGDWLLERKPGEVKVWDLEHRRETRNLIGHTNQVTCVAFSPDGQRLATGSMDRTIRVWSLETGAATVTLMGHKQGITNLAFSPDGQKLASASADRTIKIWDPLAGRDVLTLRGHTNAVGRVAFSSDGGKLASASRDNTVRLWTLGRIKESLFFELHGSAIASLAFSPDNQRLATASWIFTEGRGQEMTVWIWNMLKQQPVLRSEGHKGDIVSIAFAPDGRCLAIEQYKGELRVWDAITGKDEFSLPGYEYVRSVAFGPNSRRIAVGADVIKIWDTANQKELVTFKGLEGLATTLAFSPDGRHLGASDFVLGARLWDLTTAREAGPLSHRTRHTGCIAISPNGRWLASGSGSRGSGEMADEPGIVQMWDLSTRDLIFQKLEGHPAPVTSVAFSPDNKRLASGGRDGTIRLWDTTTGQLVFTLEIGSPEIAAVSFSSDGKYLACAAGGIVHVWEALPADKQP